MNSLALIQLHPFLNGCKCLHVFNFIYTLTLFLIDCKDELRIII